MEKLKKKFPAYFDKFVLPEGAKEQYIEVFRACKTNNLERESFLPTYEENNYSCCGEDTTDPGEYSLSTYEKPKDVKRFTATNNQFRPPYKIAKGITEPSCGPSQRTKERKPKLKSSHVDWWIYENEEPNKHFELIQDFEKFYSDYNKRGENDNNG